MSKFLYYIFDSDSGDIKGTNDLDVVEKLRKQEELFIVHAQAGVIITPDETEEVHEIELDEDGE